MQEGFRSLEGKKVKHAIVMHEKGRKALPILVFEDGTHVEFWADAEGNGPGHAEVVAPVHHTLMRRVAR